MTKGKLPPGAAPQTSCAREARLAKAQRFAMGGLALLIALLIWIGWDNNLQAQLLPPPARGQQARILRPSSQSPVLLRDVEDRIWRLTNEVRRQYHLPPVNRQDAFFKVSEAYSVDMLVRHFFSHINPEGLTAGDRLKPYYPGPIYAWGENIWEGSNVSTADHEDLARLIMKSWMASPGHRENILNPKYTELGVGVAVSGREIRATQLFATLQRH